MRYIALSSLVMLIGCASPNSQTAGAALTWDFQSPSEVVLVVNGERHQVIANNTYQYHLLHPSEFSSYRVPPKASTAAWSWYAGSGDVIYAIQKSNSVFIYQREMDESEGRPFPAKQIATIALDPH